MFVWYRDRTGKMAPYRLEGHTDAHYFPTRDYANTCAEQLVRDQSTTVALVITLRGRVADQWKRRGWRVCHARS
jgi:hypothetical protein